MLGGSGWAAGHTDQWINEAEYRGAIEPQNEDRREMLIKIGNIFRLDSTETHHNRLPPISAQGGPPGTVSDVPEFRP